MNNHLNVGNFIIKPKGTKKYNKKQLKIKQIVFRHMMYEFFLFLIIWTELLEYLLFYLLAIKSLYLFF